MREFNLLKPKTLISSPGSNCRILQRRKGTQEICAELQISWDPDAAVWEVSEALASIYTVPQD